MISRKLKLMDINFDGWLENLQIKFHAKFSSHTYTVAIYTPVIYIILPDLLDSSDVIVFENCPSIPSLSSISIIHINKTIIDD